MEFRTFFGKAVCMRSACRVLSWLLLCCLLLTSRASTVHALEPTLQQTIDASLWMEPVEIVSGKECSLSVILNGASVGAGSFRLQVDPEVIRVKGISPGAVSPIVNLAENSSGTVRVAWASTTPAPVGSILFSIMLIAQPTNFDKTTSLQFMDLQLFDAQAVALSASAETGLVTICRDENTPSSPSPATGTTVPGETSSGASGGAIGGSVPPPAPLSVVPTIEPSSVPISQPAMPLDTIVTDGIAKSEIRMDQLQQGLLDSSGTWQPATSTTLLDLADPTATVVPSITRLPVLSFEMASNVAAEQYHATFPAGSVSDPQAQYFIQLQTPIADVLLPSNLMTGNVATGAFAPNAPTGEALTLKISRVNTSGLSASVQQAVGDRPVIQLEFNTDSKSYAWNNPQAPVTVRVPYTPTAADSSEYGNLVVWYVDEAGKTWAVPSGSYDATNGSILFTVTHFSRYAIVLSDGSGMYPDVSSMHWARTQLEAMSIRGMTDWVVGTNFEPNRNLTRAEFIIMLVKALGLTSRSAEQFFDVPADSAYAQAVGISRQLGVVKGTGDNLFRPNDSITRQDMSVMVERAMALSLDAMKPGSLNTLKPFSDASQIAPYASTAMATLVSNGILVGSGAIINPRGTVTRAQGVVIGWRLRGLTPYK